MVNHGNMYGPNFSFLGVSQCDLDDPASYQGADVIIIGAPIDSGTSHRSGAKFGPQAIRMGDYLPHDGERPHLTLRVDGLKDLKVLDAGDLMMPPGDLVASLEVLKKATERISRAGAIAVVLGGDHSIASADVAGIAAHRGMGKVSMIHFDAHADTGDLARSSVMELRCGALSILARFAEIDSCSLDFAVIGQETRRCFGCAIKGCAPMR